MITFITYSNNQPFEKYGENIINQAKQYFDETYHYKAKDIEDFKKQNISLWKYNKGDGFWSWKPYIIERHMLKNKDVENNIIVYSDTRFNMVGDIAQLVKQYFSETNKNIFATKNHHFSQHSRHKEVMWSKGDAFKGIGVDMHNLPYEEQIWAGFLCFRNNDQTREIVNEWLFFCKDEKIISNTNSLSLNHPTFVENRYDQTILSLILKKYSIDIKDDKLSDILSMGNHMKYFYP